MSDQEQPVQTGVDAPLITVVLPDGQEVTGRLHERRQTPGQWWYWVGVPAWRNTDDGGVEASEYRVWVRAPAMVRPVDGISYNTVPTRRMKPPTAVDTILGPRRPTGWVLQKAGPRRTTGPAVVHAPDCSEAPFDVQVLGLDAALTATEQAGVTLCSLCGAAQELEPLLDPAEDSTATP
ncbi:DUF6233 domain-containing protein [Streptomyces sp. NPDC127068]|uniref:DUF6233 domain-containing protein n=1 Tax=Streptomyces sp. NPDC127068 TaxID=3347127 RepID=UPI003659195B